VYIGSDPTGTGEDGDEEIIPELPTVAARITPAERRNPTTTEAHAARLIELQFLIAVPS
jgi:hypothetical protein